MARLMSVAYTEQAVIERRKRVTRRKGWWLDKNGRRLLQVGDGLTLVRKAMGRKPGEPLVRVAEVEVVSIWRERLGALLINYGPEEIAAEGFPGMAAEEFIDTYFVAAQGMCDADTVTRIEWRYLDEEDGRG